MWKVMNATPKHVQYVYLMTIHYYPYSKTAEVDQAPHRKNPISSLESDWALQSHPSTVFL